uniref:Platelet endothelial cell adhesion molecule n=1 Tax=Cynoglossus semilaevis TaxID=244447 RepID=A0A3P8WQX8_CYNSE
MIPRSSVKKLQTILTIHELSLWAGQSRTLPLDNVGLWILPANTVPSGTSVTLQCQVTVSHDNTAHLSHTFQLRRDEVLIYSITTTEDKVTFELNPSRAADSGSYECQVTVKEKSQKSHSQKLEVTGLQTPVLNLETNTLYEGNDFKATCRAPEEKGSLVFRFLRRYRNEEPQTMKTVPATGNSSETTLVLGQAGDYSLYCEYDITLVSGTRRSNHSNEEHVIVKVLTIKPVMNVLPSSNVYEGDLVEVVCRVEGAVKDVHIYLTKNKRILNETSSSILRHVFRAQEGDSGELVCKTEWRNVQKQNYYPFTVKELFSKPRLVLEPLELFEGDRMTLTCTVTVYVPERISQGTLQYTVYKNNVKITPSQSYITMAHPSNNGNYTCKAAANFRSHSFIKESQTVVVEAKVMLSKPVLSVVNGTLILGKPFQLHCHSDNGTLPIKYTLQGPKGFVGFVMVTRPEQKAIFNCPPIYKSSDLNKFICHANNSPQRPVEFGLVSQLFQTTKIIEPVSQPVLTIHPHMGDASEGQDLTLNCSVQSGTPPITFSWYHTERGALTTQTSKKLEQSFHIRNIKESHKGGYYCRSDNDASHTKQSNTVTKLIRLTPGMMGKSVWSEHVSVSGE